MIGDLWAVTATFRGRLRLPTEVGAPRFRGTGLSPTEAIKELSWDRAIFCLTLIGGLPPRIVPDTT